ALQVDGAQGGCATGASGGAVESAKAGAVGVECSAAVSVRGIGLTTNTVTEQAEPEQLLDAAILPATPPTSSDDDDDDDGESELKPESQLDEEEEEEDSDADNAAPRQSDLTSVAKSERYFGIVQLLDQQQRQWVCSGSRRHTPLAVADGYNLTAFNQINGVWPLGHPLPLPDWESGETKGVLRFDNVWQYEDFNAIVETALQRMLEETHYNTVNLFIDFYRSFKRTRRSDLRSFFQFYDVPINRRDHMCVSLAFEIMARLVELFPVLAHYLYVVSCEEQVVQLSDYIELDEEYGLNSADAAVEKEHAMAAMRIAIGEREGVMILDPGYHVGRAVTVMHDQSYPHTGWFNQSKEPHLQRDYCYSYSSYSEKFVEWKEREIRGDEANFKTSLVYVAQEYMTAIDVTVRRNLVYNFRSLLSRDAKGRVYAGIYFPLVANVHEAHMTLFYDGPNEQRVKAKLMFSAFKGGKMPDYVTQHFGKLAPQLNMSQHELADLCKTLAEVVTDQNFISQVLAINDDIGNMSLEN
ncbi:uncharacterized protein LOC115624913, partial [Scaptodrosophila lebanonensis]|uniref:Uncharacterized protein LOC115624913 n=1 Tax=Drosophila lebanonensis TaxID=7225 RepID=A0A6J2TKS1_DROLE